MADQNNNAGRNGIIDGLMDDIVGVDSSKKKQDHIVDTISSILSEYNLRTDLSFVEKLATMKFGKLGEDTTLTDMPGELQDAAFLPVNTIANIALKQDIDLLISQIPEWFRAVQIARDSICESDIVDGKLARTIKFDKTNQDEAETLNIMSKIEDCEDRLGLHNIIKNHIVTNTLEYGEGSVYAIPYAKVFEDLYKYRQDSASQNKKSSVASMFDTTTSLSGYGYGESAVEVSLTDAMKDENGKPVSVFTEAEIMEIHPGYHDTSNGIKTRQKEDEEIDESLRAITDNIRFVYGNIALPVVEESAHDLKCAYEEKYKDTPGVIQEFNNIFEEVMHENGGSVGKEFEHVHGIYLRVLPETKLIPLMIDRNVIGYYYISDMTNPDSAGQRKNSGLSGYTLRSPSVGYDSMSPNKMLCEKLASKIINNFDLKFMRDNTSIHQQIVAVLQAHKFNESMLRFIFIPAECVIRTTINTDGAGKGHSMLEPGLVTARMYMFLKLYTILFQINNSTVRVYNLRMSGIDKNYRGLVQETMRKFAARRITVNDMFNYRYSMTKVSGGSELIMPLGANDQSPISVDKIDAAESPLSPEFLDMLKHEAIDAQPVPSAMIKGGMSEMEFAKEVELSNTMLNTFVASCKIELNDGITKLYRRILRWETDIDPEILKDLRFAFRMPAAKHLNITSEMLQNFNAIMEIAIPTFLTAEETKESENGQSSEVVREFRKLLISEFIPPIDVERFDELANQARNNANKNALNKSSDNKNILDESTEGEEI